LGIYNVSEKEIKFFDRQVGRRRMTGLKKRAKKGEGNVLHKVFKWTLGVGRFSGGGE